MHARKRLELLLRWGNDGNDRISYYQDLDLAYENRPSYFVEPQGNWGEGRVESALLGREREERRRCSSSLLPLRLARLLPTPSARPVGSSVPE